ncbi:HigA family addiction module antidote protein [Oryzomonas sagensis]|jgi:addiction module HigA family antidote|uniref:HigA family addiction module antidote protein n=1 Tax=Oryzomonas sagensis TaxID=2603857 RepID=A0ABQ6TQ63_9BACT|nr:HigA family addiction module antitoxin [Oryzomonas sagensis]KAB0671153.1 HigA family addiction module antidote protein [Oryzomonas sagensis]
MATKNGLPAIHPGEYLKEILEELGLSQNAFAGSIGVSAMRVSHVIHGKRPVTAELAVLFGKAFGQTPQYWMNLQTSYDLKITEKIMAHRVRQIRPIALAA